jgi:hypothetical protein
VIVRIVDLATRIGVLHSLDNTRRLPVRTAEGVFRNIQQKKTECRI